jgi:peptide deformylase
MKLNIQTGEDNPILRATAPEVTQGELKTVLLTGTAMLKWLKNKSNGAGLAAPQVGLSKRMIVVNLYEEEDGELHLTKTLLMINPVVLSESGEIESDEEGCFSRPGMYGQVLRRHSIEIEFRNERYLLKRLSLEGFNARVVLHEIDHLNGVLFTDKVQGKLLMPGKRGE